jgi:hypothetical protein
MKTILFSFSFIILSLLVISTSWAQEKPVSSIGKITIPSTVSSDGTKLNTNVKNSVTPVKTTDGTVLTTNTTGDGTAITTAPQKVSKPSKKPTKQKIIVKKVDPGFMTPPALRLSPMGPNAIWGGIGIKTGLSDNATGGFLAAFGYSYRVTRELWLDSQFGVNFGGDCTKPENEDDGYVCGGLNGFGLEILGGLLWRFLDKPPWDIPLNPYVRALAGFAFIISNGPNDGVALVVKGAGGAKYSITDEFAVGAEMGITIGPSFRNVIGAGAFVGFDLIINAEYSF